MSTSIALVIFSKGVSFIPIPTITLDNEASSFNTHKTLLLATMWVSVLLKVLTIKHQNLAESEAPAISLSPTKCPGVHSIKSENELDLTFLRGAACQLH